MCQCEWQRDKRVKKAKSYKVLGANYYVWRSCRGTPGNGAFSPSPRPLVLNRVKTDAKVMLTVNVDMQDCLINDQAGKIRHTKFANGGACKVYLKFPDKQTKVRVTETS